jgi:hypothetical protein
VNQKPNNPSEEPYDPSDDPDADPRNVQSVTRQPDQAEGEDYDETS